MQRVCIVSRYVVVVRSKGLSGRVWERGVSVRAHRTPRLVGDVVGCSWVVAGVKVVGDVEGGERLRGWREDGRDR